MSAIETLMNVGQPQMAYNWEINLRSPFTIVDNLKFRARSMSIPDDASEPIQIPHKFYDIWYPGRDASAHTIDLSFWDNEDLDLYTSINAWREAIQSLVLGVQAPKNAIIGIADMHLLKANGQISKTWILINAWPENVQPTTLDYTTNDAITISFTMRYDLVTKPVV